MLAFTASAVSLMLLPLPDLLMSGSSAVRGGLGGALVGAPGFAGDEFLLLEPSWLTSVASGVKEGFRTSSLLPTASRLWALLKVGYEVAGRTSPLPRRSISGTTLTEDLDLFLMGEAGALGESRSRSRSRLADFRLCKGSLLELADLR